MKTAPTLIDALYRASFRPEIVPGWRSNVAMRHALESARRFVVDDSMSAFMAELANESFLKVAGKPVMLRIADSLRVQARPPHQNIWIEYQLRSYQTRSRAIRSENFHNFIAGEVGGVKDGLNSEVPEREGWLIQQHPKLDTACIMHLFTQSDTEHEDGFNTWTFPFAFAWSCDDNPLPWHHTIAVLKDNPAYKLDSRWRVPSSYLVGIGAYDRENVNCVISPLIDNPKRALQDQYAFLLKEWMGVLRRVWSLLATIDNVPMRKGEVRQSKGFLARGRIRKFLNHTTITLSIPGKQDTRVIARKLIAIAHRKRHEVRGHWRDDWRNPPSKKCNPHIWEVADDKADIIRCDMCGGRQFYIHKHERGDASLGYSTHDYRVVHEENK